MCYCLLKGHTKEKLWTCFESLNWSCKFSNIISLPHPWNKARAKPPWVPSTTIIHAHSTLPFSKCFQSCGYIKKCADSGTRNNVVCLWRLLLARVQCVGYVKKCADSGTRTNVVCLRRLFLARVHLPGLHKEMCCSGTRTNVVCLGRLLLARVQLRGLRKEIYR